MSSLTILGDTSGSVVLQAPAVAGSSTITLPTTGGTMRTTTTPGTILQVVNGTYGTQVEASFSSLTDLGLSATITPTSSSSKILILTSGCACGVRNTATYWDLYLYRGSTYINTLINYIGANTSASGIIPISVNGNWLDSPATTSATTYSLKGLRTDGSGTCVFNLRTGNSVGSFASMTLMEIAG